MTVRPLSLDDINELKRIHERYYKNEFELPDFVTNYLCSFVVLDEDSQIISAVGVRTIIEVVAMTDKDRDIHDRLEALNRILTVSSYISKEAGYDEIHAFVQEEIQTRWMEHAGFRSTRGKALVIGV